MSTDPVAIEHASAIARGVVLMDIETSRMIAEHGFAKGDVLGVARIAAIQGAKRTAELVPYAQEALLGAIAIDFVVGQTTVAVESRVSSRDANSVEMEALTACIVAALTIYDMCKAVDRSMSIGSLTIVRPQDDDTTSAE